MDKRQAGPFVEWALFNDENKPEENIDCLVYPDCEGIIISRLMKGKFKSWGCDIFGGMDWVNIEGKVTHWMYAPKDLTIKN